jgi:O-succinylbenzoic acid--CoA ligase
MTLAETLTLNTSGSGGRVKPVTLTAQTLYASAAMGREIEDLRAGDCWLNCLSNAHVGGAAIAYRCAAAAATMRRHPRFDPQQIEQELEQGEITHLSLVPVMLFKLLQQYGERRPSTRLRTVLVGGDRLPKTLAQQAVAAGWPLVVCYGMTETASRITMLRLTPESIGPWEEHDVGPPLPGVELEIAAGGEIHIRSERLFPGEGRVIISGDRGEIDARGHLHLHGRVDGQFLSGGVLIDPLAVEQQLRCCPAIGEVGVTSVSDPHWGAIVVAVVEQPLGEEARRWIVEQLPSAIRPRRFQVVEQLQYRGVGKLDRRWLQRVAQHVA